MKPEKFVILIQCLRSLRLPGMAEELTRQYNDPDSCLLPADDRLYDLIMAEDEWRGNNKFLKDLKAAGLRYPEAVISTEPGSCAENVSPDLLNTLTEDRWIELGRNLIITGGAGTGKTYLACGLAQTAISRKRKVLYKRTTVMLEELKQAEKNGSFQKELNSLLTYDLLILDDFALYHFSEENARLLFELADCRDGRKSTVFISQQPVGSWYHSFENTLYAEICLDRCLHNAYRINIEGPSRRSRDPEQQEEVE